MVNDPAKQTEKINANIEKAQAGDEKAQAIVN